MSEILDQTKKLALMIGMCARARKIVIGCDQVCTALPEKKAQKKVRLVLEAADVSENTHKKLCDKCLFYNVQKEIIPLSQEELAHAIGKKGSMVAAVAVTDEQMSRAVINLLPESQNQA